VAGLGEPLIYLNALSLVLPQTTNVAAIHNLRSSHATKEKKQTNVQASFGSYDHRVDNSDRLASCRTSPIEDKGGDAQLSACAKHWTPLPRPIHFFWPFFAFKPLYQTL
jgi:hypothetical protein